MCKRLFFSRFLCGRYRLHHPVPVSGIYAGHLFQHSDEIHHRRIPFRLQTYGGNYPNITETAEIVKIIKPVYNFKAT